MRRKYTKRAFAPAVIEPPVALPPPSTEQKNILGWVKNRRSGALVVRAVAGSGKTTLLRMITEALNELGYNESQILYMAFSKSLCDEMTPKLAGKATVRSIHSTGFHSLTAKIRGVKLKTDKKNVVNSEVLDTDETMKSMPDGKRWWVGEMLHDIQSKLILGLGGTSLQKVHELIGHNPSWLKVWAYDTGIEELGIPEDTVETLYELREEWAAEVEELVDHYGIKVDSEFATPLVALLVWASDDKIVSDGSISYDEMISYPCRMGFPFKQYPIVLVDEAQDLSPAQRGVALASLAPGGRIIFVGDPKQAIMGFAGASCESIQEIIDETGAETLPLSVSYRCPTSHIDLAQQIVPEIEPTEWAKEGIIRHLDSSDEVIPIAQSGDLMIARRTAPVMQMALRLLSRGIQAKVKGEKVDKRLVWRAADILGVDKSLIYRLTKANIEVLNRVPMARFLAQSESYAHDKMTALSSKWPQKLQGIMDEVEALEEIFTLTKPATFNDLISIIKSAIDDGSTEGGVVLSTIHRAKGLEADRVFILDANRISVATHAEWQAEQESNLHYVALTRSKHELFIVA